GESYPQVLTFRMRIKNLYQLTLIAFLSIACVMWIYVGGSEVPPGSGFPPTNIVMLPVYVFLWFFLPVKNWLAERKLLRHARFYWGNCYSHGESLRYEFYGENGDRFGGTVGGRSVLADPSDNVALIIVNAKDPDDSKPSFAFRFHDFLLIRKE